MTYEEKMKMRTAVFDHLAILLDKVHGMFASGKLTIEQMGFAGDILKDIAKAESAISKACYYDSINSASSDKTY